MARSKYKPAKQLARDMKFGLKAQITEDYFENSFRSVQAGAAREMIQVILTCRTVAGAIERIQQAADKIQAGEYDQ